MARPKLYENAAERQAAFRAEKDRIDLTVPKELGETISEISEILGITKNALVTAMIKHSLTNHNWKKSGMWVTKK